ncbi:riboflavin transporter 2-like [Diadema antillarum]|uniref:riboflavin transporter 2-like n=1 Tax=Diadema antillarum TaxID=105358 RepID=UPI003A8A6BE6
MYCKVSLPQILTSVLLMTFGMSTWVTLSGIWVELPLLTNFGIDEGYKIGSYVIVVTQGAVIGPLIFVVVQRVVPKDYRLEVPVIYIVLALGAVGSFLLIFLWDDDTFWPLDGSDHSTAFLVLTFFISFVDSTSNLTFIAFVEGLKQSYLNLYFIGEGLSAILPSLMVLIQGSGADEECLANSTYLNVTVDPETNITVIHNCTEWVVGMDHGERFSPQMYFSFIFSLTAISAASFCLLRWMPILQGEYEIIKHNDTADENPRKCWCCCLTCNPCNKGCHTKDEEFPMVSLRHREQRKLEGESILKGRDKEGAAKTPHNGNSGYNSLDPTGHFPRKASRTSSLDDAGEDNASDSMEDSSQQCSSDADDDRQHLTDSVSKTRSCSGRYAFLFVTLTIISGATYGFLPSIESYSAGAYGADIYLLVATFAEMSAPVGFLLVTIYPTNSYVVVALTSAGGMMAGSYCMVAALLSPTPPFHDQSFGKVFILLAWILQGLCFSYCRATIAGILRAEEESRKLLLWFGGFTTLGTMLGAFIMFPLVSILGVFTEYVRDPCAGFPACLVVDPDLMT